ncbi:kinase-like domain-containing protein [Glomus cerebriforme]|uniref:Kinase-like domain-containing protein n=1 Tax=Glomus cerebriforme TaxID=658196 RepID=A0A397T6K1_9GLOM|nr:kinase-like domain-containing protein [Glomus cerebriforme]
MDSDTELDMEKQRRSIHTAGSVNSSSYSFCGLSTKSSNTSQSLMSELDSQKLSRIKRYADESGDIRFKSKSKSKSKENSSAESIDSASKTKNVLEAETINLREEVISSVLENTKKSLQVDLCFVLDCTEFKKYLSDKVKATGGGDGPEDVLGGLDAAVNKMRWSHRTRVLLHLGDAPPHGRRFTSRYDNYPDGDPNGLTAEDVLEKIQSEEILYYFGKITNQPDKMLSVFRDIIGEFLVFDLNTDGKDSEALTTKLFEAVCSSITSSVILTSSEMGSVYERKRKNLEKDLCEPDWDTLPVKTGKLLHYLLPKTLADIKDSEYFTKPNLILRKFTYKHALKPFSSGSERYAYYALDLTREPAEKIIMKECVEHGRKANSLERYLEMIETSSIAYFLSKKFNSAAKQVDYNKKVKLVKFLKPQALRHKDDSGTQCYTIEPNLLDSTFKHFNVNNGIIKEYHSTLEAFAHYTYEYTKGYLVVYDLQGIKLEDKFLLTDPAIHCEDRLRFGKTNLGKRGIEQCFLANHECGNVCEKLGLPKITKITI